MEPPFKEAMLDADEEWGDIEVWQAMKIARQEHHAAFLAAAVDFSIRRMAASSACRSISASMSGCS